MSTTTGADLCRVTIVAPRRRIDLSIPADVPLSHMVPTLLRAAGQDLADAGLAHGGWVLQRLDGPAFDESRTLAALGVRDGEVLYFRPRMGQLPDLAFDDVADVIATGIRDGTDRWRPRTTRDFGLAAAGALLLAGALALLFSGPEWLVLSITAGVLSVLLVIGGIVLSRAVGDAGAGSVLGYCALVYAFLGGLLAPAGATDGLRDLGAPHLLAAFGAASLVAIVAGFTIAEGLPNFLGAALAALIGTLCAGIVLADPSAPPVGLAAIATSLCVALTALIPSLAFRLARLPLPSVPANADELRRDTLPVNGQAVLRRTGEADRFATGLVLGVGLVALVSQVFLVTAGGWLATTTSLVVAAVLLLRARVFQGRTQRGWLLLTGLAGPALLGVRFAVTGTETEALTLVVIPLAVVVTILIALALWLPTHKPTPFWGRSGDIVDLTLIIGLIPLALGLLNLYSWVRGLAG